MENKKTNLQEEFNKKKKKLSDAYKNYLESKKDYNQALTEYKHFVKKNLVLKEL